MPEAWKQWEGQIVNSRFVLRRYLGGSQQSAVFLTERQNSAFDKAAIKLIASSGATPDFHFARWHKAAQLSHPHLLRLFHYGQCKVDGIDLWYAVTELAEEDLAQILPGRALNALEAREVLLQVGEALAFLHAAGLVHRRVCPSNILAVGDAIKLSSDSVCPFAEAASEPPPSTPYDAPEIAMAGARASRTAAADVYSLGVVLVESLTQKVPERGTLPPDLVHPFDEIAEKALHADPELRCTAADILTRLNSRPAARAPAPEVASELPQNPVAATASEAIKANPASAMPATQSSPSRLVAQSPKPRVPEAPIPPRPSPITAESLSSYHHLAHVLPESVALSSVPPPASRQARRSGLGLSIAGVATVLVLLFFVPRMFRHRAPAEPSGIIQAASENAQASRPQRQTSPAASAPQQKASTHLSSHEGAAQPTVGRASPTGASPKQDAPQAELNRKAHLDTPSPTPVRAASPGSVSSTATSPTLSSTQSEGVTQQFLPEVAQKALNTIRGTVRVGVRVGIDAMGNVQSADLANPSGSDFFNKAALQAARRWQFQSAGSSAAELRHWLLRFEFTPSTIRAQPVPVA